MNNTNISKDLAIAVMDTMIDLYIDVYGVRECIEFLYTSGFTKQNLLDLLFDEEDVDIVIDRVKNNSEVDEEYDDADDYHDDDISNP